MIVEFNRFASSKPGLEIVKTAVGANYSQNAINSLNLHKCN